MKEETLSECGSSVLAARKESMKALPNQRPEVLRDLWDVFEKPFQLVVFKRFKKTLVMHSERHEADCACALHLFGDSRAYFWQELAPCFDGPILTRVIDVVRDAFPSWAALRESSDTAELGKQTMEWSDRWDLKADWWRDHALSVLRYWLQDEDLPFTRMSPQIRHRVKTRGWVGATIWN